LFLPVFESGPGEFATSGVGLKTTEILKAWGYILGGRAPSLSIEITRECPLRCPGCYAYEDSHLGGGGITLRDLADRRGADLVQGVLELVDRYEPLHLSIVGGDPLVRYRELEELLPQLTGRGIHVQVVTSAFRQIPEAWSRLPRLSTVVSIDGLQPEHDQRRKPATYARILKNIAAGRITVHCTITAQMMQSEGYLGQFVEFWSARPEVRKIWFSLFTPQRGDVLPEILTQVQREQAITELTGLKRRYAKLDMPERLIHELAHPPASPADCIFAQTTRTISADLETAVTPCQFGGDPDCGQCGCMASIGLAAVGRYKIGGIVPVGSLYRASAKIGRIVAGRKEAPPARTGEPFPILR
jgi:MoaA/NifB/PqqE/SkfB family radical SAM enzyme